MNDESYKALAEEFNEHLRNAAQTVARCTPLGVKKFIGSLSQLDPLDTAKTLLTSRDIELSRGFVLPAVDEYFHAAIRIGRPELTIEYAVLDPRWESLFTEEDRSEARRRLMTYGSEEGVERCPLPEFAPFWRELYRLHLEVWLDLHDADTDCERVRRIAEMSEEQAHPIIHPLARQHLAACLECNTAFSTLAAGYQEFDSRFFDSWNELLQHFEIAYKLDRASLERFLEYPREDSGGDELGGDWEIYAEDEINNSIKPLACWRALRLGAFIGNAMKAFARTFPGRSDIWFDWWQGVGQRQHCEFVRAVGPKRFQLALQSRKISALSGLEFTNKELFWIPSDEGLEAISGVLWVEHTDNLDDWEEVQGSAPSDLNVASLLWITAEAALSEIGALLADEQRDEFEVARLEQLNWAWTPDRCTEFWSATLPGVWSELDDLSKEFLVSSQQLFNLPRLSAPSLVVSAWAQAFECELRKRIVRPLHNALKRAMRNQGGRAVLRRRLGLGVIWDPTWSPNRYTLDQTVRLLQDLDPSYFQHFVEAGYDRGTILEAIKLVKDPRNRASHGSSMSQGEVLGLRREFFDFKGLTGGVFAALVPLRQAPPAVGRPG